MAAIVRMVRMSCCVFIVGCCFGRKRYGLAVHHMGGRPQEPKCVHYNEERGAGIGEDREP